ncbi:hypothetical protein [Agrococcus jejuensis]|nr:hypothetical protein [Agrococcus jejuensis]
MPTIWRSARPLLRTRSSTHDLRWLSRRAFDARWFPQGIDVGTWRGRRTIAVTWYRKDATGEGHEASRVTLIDVRRSTSVDLALAVETADGTLEPARIHAGGLAWLDDGRLLVAATFEGLWEFDVHATRTVVGADARRLSGSRRRGARCEVLVRTRVHDVPLRCSFVGRVTPAAPGVPRIVAGEYRSDAEGRIGWHDVPAGDGPWDAWSLEPTSIPRMQGVVDLDGELLISQSRGMQPGRLWRGRRGAMTRSRHALPIGCEDLAVDEAAGMLWTVAEHPWRRRVHGIPLAALGAQ